VQDITREPIDIVIKASESAVSQAVDFAMRTDEINKRLIKSTFKQHIVTCATFAFILIFLFGFYFVGYRDYPEEVTNNVEESQGSTKENILQTPKVERSESNGIQ
jgi:uncharacterized membrane protein YvbJ